MFQAHTHRHTVTCIYQTTCSSKPSNHQYQEAVCVTQNEDAKLNVYVTHECLGVKKYFYHMVVENYAVAQVQNVYQELLKY